MLVLSLPIPIIAGNFEDFHRMQQTKTKAEKAKKKLTEGNARVSLEFFANRCLRVADHASVVCVCDLYDIASATNFAGGFDLA